MSKKLDEKIEKMDAQKKELLALRHTCEHVLHTAMQTLYPTLKKAMGPATDDGFYFDFELYQKISEEQFPAIEKEMRKLINANIPMVQSHVSFAEAKKIFSKNPYKLEWVEDIEKRGEKISLYSMGDNDTDLCSGPHAKSTGEIKAFTLLSVAGAYWHGDEKNKMLTRIYGTAFFSQSELDEYLALVQEAKKRDHRKLGKDLGLFVFADLVGKGLPMLTSKGATIRRILERFTVDEEVKRGYEHVVTPPLAKVDLYRTSGHYPYYKETMYPPMVVDEDELILRPMTCPHHFMLYSSEPRSYRDLPVRYAELADLFRYEKSGELTGLMRVRMFCLADAHIICRRDQALEEIHSVLDLIEYINTTLGLKKGIDYRYRLSLGDRTDEKKYFKDDEAWDHAEKILREVLIKRNAPFYEAHGEAAFYGPKIDIQINNVMGKEETAFTCQYDFVMPKRFNLSYTDADGEEKQPIVIHRSSIGAFERTMAFLIEKYAGAFPVWLSPVQVLLIPISERHSEAVRNVAKQLQSENIRVQIDDRSETMQAKIRASTLQKVPYMGIMGDREIEKGTISIRTRDGKTQNGISIQDFICQIKKEIETRSV